MSYVETQRSYILWSQLCCAYLSSSLAVDMLHFCSVPVLSTDHLQDVESAHVWPSLFSAYTIAFLETVSSSVTGTTFHTSHILICTKHWYWNQIMIKTFSCSVMCRLDHIEMFFVLTIHNEIYRIKVSGYLRMEVRNAEEEQWCCYQIEMTSFWILSSIHH